MNVIGLISSSNFIVVNKSLAREIGLIESVVLGELASEYDHWKATGNLDDGYFYSTVDNLSDNTTLSKYQQRAALDNLKEKGIIEVTVKGLPAKRYIKINEEQVEKLLNNKLSKNSPTGCQVFSPTVGEKLDGNNNKDKNKNNNNSIKKEYKESPQESDFTALERLGTPLSGYPLLNQTETPKLEHRTENNDFSTENISVQTEDFPVQTVPVSEQYQRLQTENTTENLCKKERRASAKAKNHDSIIDSETENEQLREAYREFLKMRKLKKDPMTNHALKLLIGKVNKLSRGDEQCTKDLPDEAIISGWKSVYPPKNYNNTGGSINSNAPRSGDVFLDYLDEQLEIEQGK